MFLFNVIQIVLITQLKTLTGIKFITWTWAIFLKNPETGQFLFFLGHRSGQLPLTFFFKYKVMPGDTSFERLFRKEYNTLQGYSREGYF
jgi:hypothetical protein